jgi:hypothetical protein
VIGSVSEDECVVDVERGGKWALGWALPEKDGFTAKRSVTGRVRKETGSASLSAQRR